MIGINIEKELLKKQKRDDSYAKRRERHKQRTERRNRNRERIKPIKEWWYSINRKSRYKRQLRRICSVIIPNTKVRYLYSLLHDSSPNCHFPIFGGRSTAFHPEDYVDGFRLQRYQIDGLSYKKKKLEKCLCVIEKLGYSLEESFLNDLRVTLEKGYSKDYQVSPIQYEYMDLYSEKKKLFPYFILSINGPHPRKKL